tara:strand:- start:1639 stop:2046 length:408 start_codon:yes stop_codon:yes gene_type:complete
MLHFLPAFAESYGLTIAIDWSGEYNENDLINFINQRLKELNEVPLSDEITKKIRKEQILGQHERGEFIKRQFRILGDALRERKIELKLLNDGSDQYYPFVFTESSYLGLPAKPTNVFFGCFDTYSLDEEIELTSR